MTTIQKLEGFSNLPVGWNYGAGVAPTRRAIALATAFVSIYQNCGFPTTDAFPGTDGEIMITAYEGDHYVEITLETDGKIRFVYEVENEEKIYKEGLSIYQAAELLSTVAEQVEAVRWPSLESSIPFTTMILTGSNLRTWHSGLNEPRMARKQFPVSNMSVQYATAELYAPTLPTSIRSSRRPRQFIGSSTNPTFPLVAA
ncbi:hypothetical protein [Lichenicola sp.]|uniref:hypothetical protein n=1 Tax=Lichenicola sp. TaxID=2804529 RepID=UPI003B004E61